MSGEKHLNAFNFILLIVPSKGETSVVVLIVLCIGAVCTLCVFHILVKFG